MVDTGRVKRKTHDVRSGVSRFEVGWVSQAAADQRAGRAGRTGPGHCYRLYSSAVFAERCPAFEEPELLRSPLEGVLLSMKVLGIDCVARFPFPSPPPPAALHEALRSLTNLGAIVPRVRRRASSGGGVVTSTVVSETLTALGRAMAALPLHPPALAKLLVLANQAADGSDSSGGRDRPTSLLEYAIALVACVTVQQLLHLPAAPAEGSGDSDDGGDAGDGSTGDAATTAAERALLAALEVEETAAAEQDTEAAATAAAESAPSLAAGESGGAWGASAAAAVASMTAAGEAEAAAARRARARAAEDLARAELRELRARAAAAHARFRHPLSDALTLLNVCGAYSHAVAVGGAALGATFCREHFLRARAMDEVSKLRQQLHAIVHAKQSEAAAAGASEVAAALASGDVQEANEEAEDEKEHDGSGAAPAALRRRLPFRLQLDPLPAASAMLLRQLLTAAQFEHLARRATPSEAAALLSAAGVHGRLARTLVPYVPSSPSLPAALFLHPFSATHDRDGAAAPDFVVFSEVVVSSRPYMRGVTVADAAWLHAAAGGTPLVRFEPPLISPPPFYQVAAGGVDGAVCYRAPLVGERQWRLTPVLMPLPVAAAAASGSGWDAEAEAAGAMLPADTPLRLFARALLEGGVAPLLASFAGHLALPASDVMRRVPQARAALLLAELQRRGVGSAATLAVEWRAQPAYLLAEVQAWLPEALRPVLAQAWRKVVDDFLLRQRC